MLMNVQILRGLAATLVVWAHLSEMSPMSPFFKYGPTGLEGVDLFFVISGFIIVYTTEAGKNSSYSFLVRRFVRVAPLYYIATLAVIIVYLVMPTAFKSTAVDIDSIVKSILFIPFEKSEGRIYPLYYLGWTLNYEMLFYVLFALSIRISQVWRAYICSAAIVILVAMGLFINADEYGAIAYAFTRPIMLDFVLGMIIAKSASFLLSRTGGNLSLYVLMTLVGAALLVTLNKFVDAPYTLAPITNTFLSQGLPAGLLVLGAVLLERAGRSSKANLLTAIGDSSYSLYLFHFFMIAFLMKISDRFAVSGFDRGLVAVAALPVIWAASYLIYVLVERPMTKVLLGLRRQASNQPLPPLTRAGET